MSHNKRALKRIKRRKKIETRKKQSAFLVCLQGVLKKIQAKLIKGERPDPIQQALATMTNWQKSQWSKAMAARRKKGQLGPMSLSEIQVYATMRHHKSKARMS